jgi:ankyrin repeat protein
LEQLCKIWPNHVNATSPNPDLGTALNYALELWRLECARILIGYGALGDLEINRNCLLDIGTSLNHESWLAHGLYDLVAGDLAIRCIDLISAIAPSLLDTPQELGFTPLMQAAQTHDATIVRHLLHLGCSATSETPYENDGRTALNLLTENQLQYEPDDIIELLLAAGANLNHKSSKGGKNLLHFAARDNIVWIAERTLTLGIDIESRTTYGETPLHCAAFYGGFDVGRLLLSRKANTEVVHDYGTINAYDWKGLTPIAWAAVRFRRAFIEMLLEFKASIVARPRTRSTLLHLAVGEVEVEDRLLGMLLEMPAFRKAEVLNARDTTHNATALHYCVGNIGREKHSLLLIEASADVHAVTSEGFSVLDLAFATKGWLCDAIELLGREDAKEDFNSKLSVGEDQGKSLVLQEGAQTKHEAETNLISLGVDQSLAKDTTQYLRSLVELNHQVDLSKAYRAITDIIRTLEAWGAQQNQPEMEVPPGLMSLD